MVKSGLQKDVLRLYKQSLQMVASKPVDKRAAWFYFVNDHFRHPTLGGGLRPRDVGAIEYNIRKGKKMLEAYSSPSVKSVAKSIGSYPLNWIAKGGKHGAK